MHFFFPGREFNLISEKKQNKKTPKKPALGCERKGFLWMIRLITIEMCSMPSQMSSVLVDM